MAKRDIQKKRNAKLKIDSSNEHFEFSFLRLKIAIPTRTTKIISIIFAFGAIMIIMLFLIVVIKISSENIFTFSKMLSLKGIILAVTIVTFIIAIILSANFRTRNLEKILQRKITKYQKAITEFRAVNKISFQEKNEHLELRNENSYIEMINSIKNLLPRNYDIFTPDQMPDVGSLDELKTTYRFEYIDFLSTNPDRKKLRIFYWTKMLQSYIKEENLLIDPSYIQYITYGFFDTELKQDSFSENKKRFGIIVHIEVPKAIMRHAVRILRDRNDYPTISTITIGIYKFPVFAHFVHETNHCMQINPKSGTLTCKAIPKITNPKIRLGFLTAKHVTVATVGKKVELSCGHTGRIADIGKEGIDASFVISHACKLKKGKPIPPKRLLTQYSDVEIIVKDRLPVKTKITSITETRNILNHHMIPARILLGKALSPGDSGALVIDSETREAVGIYIGMLEDEFGHTEGVAQNAFQVAATMNLDFYE